MRIALNGYQIECFENEKEHYLFVKNDSQDLKNVEYSGQLYLAPQNIRGLFTDELIPYIKRNVHYNTEYIIIHKLDA